MRIGIMGTGGIGGYYAALLARGGAEVTCIARGAHLDAIQAHGLTLQSRHKGDFTVKVNATNDPSTAGQMDVVLICVKAYDLESATELVKPMVGAHTVVIPIQNGVTHAERVSRVINPKHVVAGSAGLSARLDAPGVIVHVGSPPADITFGEVGGGASPRLEPFRDLCNASSLPADLSLDINAPLWQKFIFICAQAMTAVTRLPLGPLMACEPTREMYRQIMTEVYNVGVARGVNLPTDAVESRYQNLLRAEPRLRASMSLDVIAGRRLEIETLNGTVVKLGRELGVPTPFNFAVYASLMPHVNGMPELP